MVVLFEIPSALALEPSNIGDASTTAKPLLVLLDVKSALLSSSLLLVLG